MVSQVKVELAVLHKLFEMVEMDYGSGTSVEIVGLFETSISSGRVELALKELERSQDAMMDPEYQDQWQITREGLRRVERSLAIPSTFLARLHEKGDIWLESDEAENAVIRQRNKTSGKITESVVLLQSELVPGQASSSAWEKVGVVATVAAIPVAILIWWFS